MLDDKPEVTGSTEWTVDRTNISCGRGRQQCLAHTCQLARVSSTVHRGRLVTEPQANQQATGCGGAAQLDTVQHDGSQ